MVRMMANRFKQMLKGVVIAQFVALSGHLPGMPEEYKRRIQSSVSAGTRTRHLPHTGRELTPKPSRDNQEVGDVWGVRMWIWVTTPGGSGKGSVCPAGGRRLVTKTGTKQIVFSSSFNNSSTVLLGIAYTHCVPDKGRPTFTARLQAWNS
jgi:hypothetical protein